MSKKYVVKRNGTKQEVNVDKILKHIKRLCWGLNSEYVDAVTITREISKGICKKMTTDELDKLAAETTASYATRHPDFNKLAARIEITSLHKKTDDNFSELAKKLRAYVHPITGKSAPLLSEKVYDIIMANAEVRCKCSVSQPICIL